MAAIVDRRSALAGLIGSALASRARAQVAPERLGYDFSDGQVSTGWRPFDFWQGDRIFLPVTVNGHPVDALLDSGVSLLVIDKALGETLGLRRDARFLADGLTGEAEGDFSNGPALVDLGGVVLHTNRIALMDLSSWTDLLGRRLNVVLGRELFDQLVVDLDFEGRQLALHEPRRFGPPPGMTSLRTHQSQGVRTVPLRIDGARPVQAAFDLGAGDALSLSARYAAAHPTLKALRTATTLSYGVEGFRHPRAATVPSIELGGFRINDVPAAFMQDWSYDAVGGPPANLGIETLSRFRLVTDFPRHRLWLSPRQGLGPIPRDRTGLTTARRGDQLEILFIAPEGPAAGLPLKIGDRITALNGTPIAQAPLAAPVRWNSAPAGDAIRITLADGATHDLVLADYF